MGSVISDLLWPSRAAAVLLAIFGLLGLVLAVICIWTLIAIADVEPKYLLVAGFVFGVFPRVIWQVVSSTFKKLGGIVVPSMVSQLPVSDLDGLTVLRKR